ncbi:MAG: hypothetical protein QM726_09835 [Chitinophagaceae bacterium]
MDNYQPKTIVELQNWMKANCYNFESYAINGNIIYEGCGIEKTDGGFTWYYTERGQKSSLANFQIEADVVAHAFNEIKSDKWAKAHCIGFTENIEEHKALTVILNTMNLKFMQDKIPYYSSGEITYRTFVFGCDVNKTIHLKEKYFSIRSR